MGKDSTVLEVEKAWNAIKLQDVHFLDCRWEQYKCDRFAPIRYLKNMCRKGRGTVGSESHCLQQETIAASR